MIGFSVFRKQQTILHALLQHLKVPFTRNYLNESIKQHPNANNLLGLSDLLNGYNVENIGLKIGKDDLNKLSLPFLAQVKLKRFEFYLVTDLNGNTISVTTETGSQSKITREDFLNQWSGIVLLPNSDTESGEKNYLINRRKQLLSDIKLPFLTTILSIVVGLIMYENWLLISQYRIVYFLLLALYCAGTVISGILLQQLLNKDNPLFNKICNLTPKNGDCNDVLESPAAKLGGVISWSEIGFLFFSGNLLSLLLFPQSIIALFLFNVLSIPYTVWSIYYQARVIKQWCILCISIQAILWLCLLTCLIGNVYNQLEYLSLILLVKTFLIFLVVASAFWLLMPVIKKSYLFLPAMQELNGIKANETIFEATLKSQKEVFFDNSMVNTIMFGSSDANLIVTIVTNPFCGPCAIMHQKLETLLNQHRDFIQIRTIYAVSETVENRNAAIKHLIAVYLKYESDESEKAYSQWYENKDIDLLAAHYPVEIDEQTMRIYKAHNDWCTRAGIEATPTIYVNGYELPSWYKIEDLKYFARQ